MAEARDHPLGGVLRSAAEGRFPAVDGCCDLLTPDAAGTHAVVSFTGHAFILTDAEPASVAAHEPDGFGRATDPRLLLHLAAGGSIGSLDVVLVAHPVVAAPGADRLESVSADDHARVRRARHHRRDVHVLGDERGVAVVGRGLVDRLELSVELTGARPAAGAGRELIRKALATIGGDEPVFAQVAPGNAASLRAFLACGFVPIGSEVLMRRARA